MSRPVLLLLPEPLERFAHRGLVEELLAVGVAVVADPPRVSYRRQAGFTSVVAHRQAKRLRKRLREAPRAVVIFEPAQFPLARGLLELFPGCELWYERSAAIDGARVAELHVQAMERAHLRFGADDRDALEAALQRLL